jgi:hypothetical protein
MLIPISEGRWSQDKARVAALVQRVKEPRVSVSGDETGPKGCVSISVPVGGTALMPQSREAQDGRREGSLDRPGRFRSGAETLLTQERLCVVVLKIKGVVRCRIEAEGSGRRLHGR